MAAVEFQQVVKRFENGRQALRDVCVAIPQHSMVFLCGHSGAGKSTFLRLLMRTETASAGQVLVNGVDIARLAPRRLPSYRQHLGVVLQDHLLLGERTVFDNVALPLRIAGVRERETTRRVRAALASVELQGSERAMPAMLSAGERQRVGIARAVVNRPKLLLADEPTGNLDPALSRSVMSLFRLFQEIGATVIVASHDVDLIGGMGERIIELSGGRVARDAPGGPADGLVRRMPGNG